MKSITFGAYINVNSWLHRLDPRSKIISSILLMVGIFFIKNVYILLGLLALLFVLIISCKVPLKEFLNSIKVLTSVLIFTFIFQVLFNHSGEKIDALTFHISWQVILIDVGILILFFLFKYVARRGRGLQLLIAVGLMFLSQYFLKFNDIYAYTIYNGALLTSAKVFLRIICLVILTSSLMFSTKPSDISRAIEAFGKPLKVIHIDSSVFAMMISIALRFIPTLINEANKILKSQASRGAEFSESSLTKKVKQVVSLIVPMFIVSYKRADELANAMEARGYIPGEKRTSLYVLKFRGADYITLFMSFVSSFLLIYFGVVS